MSLESKINKLQERFVKGFTLIELMTVITILGILAAIIVPKIPDFVRKARIGKTKGNLANIRSAVNIYYADNECMYPKGPANGAFDVTYFQDCLVPKYLKKFPSCYTPPTHKESFTVDSYPSLSPTFDQQCDGEWGYVGNSNNDAWGTTFIECWHSDSEGAKWSTY